jgi:pre-rRNA-processing protein TSR3
MCLSTAVSQRGWRSDPLEEDLPIILHMAQDDPRKCTARKLRRLHRAVIVEEMRSIPYRALLLNPFSKKAFSPQDRDQVRSRGIVAVDCSWEDAERIFSRIRKVRKVESRALPMLLAANPVKFGKWGELSTLEALAAAYYIIGCKEQAKTLLSSYNWGMRFLETNLEPLEAYSGCRDSAEVVKVQSEFY